MSYVSSYKKDCEYDYPFYIVLSYTHDLHRSEKATVWKIVIACDTMDEVHEIEAEANRRGLYTSVKIRGQTFLQL
jgi:hypothetical protein